METVQVIGFIILLHCVFANGNDIYKLFNFVVLQDGSITFYSFGFL